MPEPARHLQARDNRLKRLAQSIEALTEKDAIFLRHVRDIDSIRRAAAAEIHGICSDFVNAVNSLLASGMVVLDPSAFSGDQFQDEGATLIQIHVRGRILQIAFEAAAELVSTEDFRIPYTLAGTVRAFNQALLDKDRIEEHLIFFTLEKEKHMWRFFDTRTYRSGPFDVEYLVSVMEQLL
jgi:hypothetical protein